MIWDEDEGNEKEEQKTLLSSNPFAKGKYTYDSESSEEEKRVLKTPKEKLLALIKNNYFKIKDNLESRNYIGILESFEEVMKNTDKIKKEFGTGDKLPNVFLRMLQYVEESINISKEEKAKLTQKNNTAYNSLKKEWRLVKPFEETLKNFIPGDEDIIDVSDVSRDQSQISDVSSVNDLDNAEDPAVRRLKWVKKPKEEKVKEKEKDAAKEKEDKGKGKKKKRPMQVERLITEEEEEEKPMPEKKQVTTEADIEKEINEVSNQRGHLQRHAEAISRIDYLLTLTDNLILKIKLLNLYILICFDTSPGPFSALSLDIWNKIHDSIKTLLEYFEALQKLNQPNLKDQTANISNMLQASLLSILEKLEMELYKSLQFTDQNSSEYILRIKDELKFILLCRRIENFYTILNDQTSISRIHLLILLHIYYKNAQSIRKMIERFNLNVNRDEYLIKSCENPENFITQLCNKIYTYCDEKSKIRAMLCNIYFLCVHNKYNVAKDLFNRSYIYEVIQIMKDDQLKILYNRTLAQLGLCSFRKGNYSDSLLYLHPLCHTGTTKLKEYLSQSYNKESEKSIFFDKEDKKRVIPYIMTLNIDEVESTYYLTSMVLDLPNIILYKLGKPHKSFNNVFKKMLDNFEKQIFNGPPETIKELVLYSSSFMTQGDWKKCSDLVMTLKIYNHYEIRDEIKKTINEKVKETSLKCYLIFYANEFSSLSLKKLSQKFQLEEANIKRTVSSMIINGNLDAKWNGDILELYSLEFNMKMIHRLEDNLTLITDQNLALLEAVSLKTVK